MQIALESVEMLMKRLCGPKLANCCFILSIWGIVMLLLLGIFFITRSVALREDINSKLTEKEGYKESAKNCFIAAGIYLGTLFLSLHQKWVNNRMGDTQKLSSKFWCSNCNKVIDSLPSIEHKTGGSTGNQKTKTKQKMFLFCWCGCHSSIFLIIILMIYRLMIFWRYGNKA